MRILWVKPGKLLPLDSGGKLRTYHILRHLGETHDVTYLSYYGGERDEEYERTILREFPGAFAIGNAFPEVMQVGRVVDYARRLSARAPYAVSRFDSPRVREVIANSMARGCFDVAVCDFLASAQNFPAELPTPTVLFAHNVESVLWERRSRVARNGVERWIAKIEYARMAHYEPRQVRRFHRVLVVSEQDRKAMAEMVAPFRISVIPTGVDLAQYRFDPEAQPAGPLVVFTGSMDWEPNIDGVEYFCRDVWPRVLEEVPSARFRIVGRKPHPRVQKLACASVEVTGTVPSIVDHLLAAAAVVVPLRMGSGTRIKIYESMAMGKATVSTSIGAEGLDVHHEQDILLADDPQQFAVHISRLLLDPHFRRGFETRAAEAVRRYDWKVIADGFVEELKKAVEEVRTAPASYRLSPELQNSNQRHVYETGEYESIHSR